MGLVSLVSQMARQLAPSMVVLEDVDLIAEERGQPSTRTGPLLFELLNEMDGLGDDCDIIFVLTTNRPDILEPALAARPGRIDLAVELPLPGPEGRRRLLELYARGLDATGVDWEPFVERTEGVTPAYIKELLRKAALHAAEEGAGRTVTPSHLEAAMTELAEGGRLAERIIGFRPEVQPPGPPDARPMSRPPTGFPPAGGWSTTGG
jgi:ATP-dependent 26S proteasome regulatory subunit